MEAGSSGSIPRLPKASPPIPKCKVIFLGAAGAGKTSLINRFMYEQFSRDYETTVGIDYFTKTITANDAQVSLQIWDTAGQERFESLITSYIRETQIAIIVYDVSDSKSFTSAQAWHRAVVEQRGEEARCILAGNKTDLSKSVDESAVKAFADRHKIQPFEMSAKTGDNVAQLFQAVVTTVTGMEIGKSETISVEAVPAEPAAGKSCC